MFNQSKYTRMYYQIVQKAQTRTIVEGYTEKHHIVPKSLGGSNNANNIVVLTAREHFICHWLLPKMTDGKYKRSMAHALRMMLASSSSQHSNRYIPSPKKYELVKKLANAASKGRPCLLETREKIRQGNLNRAPITEETCAKLSAAGKRRKGFTPEGRQRVIEAGKKKRLTDDQKEHLRRKRAEQVERQGTTMTAAAREKLSNAAKGRILSEDHKAKISKAHKGKVISDSTREKMKNKIVSDATKAKLSQANLGKNKGIPKKLLECPHCNKTGGEPQMKRWHFNNCKTLRGTQE